MALVLLGMIGVLAMPAFAETQSEPMKKVTPLDEISCSTGMTLIGSPTGRSACVFGGTVERMEQRGWTVIAVILHVADSAKDDETKDDVPTSMADKPQDDETKDDVPTSMADKPQDDETKDDVPVALANESHETNETDMPAIALDDKSTLGENPTGDENGEDDDKYLILGGRINLKSLVTGELVDPNPLKYPLTLEDAKAVMQRLADGFDDTVIYPPVLEDYRLNVYDTELGNTFELRWHSVFVNGEREYTGMVKNIYYDIYSHNQYDQGYILNTGARDFFKTAMEKSGFTVSSISNSRQTFKIYGVGGSISGFDWIDHYDRPVMRLEFYGWENTFPPVIPEAVALDAAKTFFANHKHLLDPKKCSFKEYSEVPDPLSNTGEPFITLLGWFFNESLQTLVHVPTYYVSMGRCEHPLLGSDVTVTMRVNAVDGKVVWFDQQGKYSAGYYLIDGWEDMVYIPPRVRSSS